MLGVDTGQSCEGMNQRKRERKEKERKRKTGDAPRMTFWPGSVRLGDRRNEMQRSPVVGDELKSTQGDV
jgi:hypothetical protein